VDARIKVQTSHQFTRYAHMAIHPYPHELTQHYQLSNGASMTIRPIRPEDAVMEKHFVTRLSERTKYFRYKQALQELTPEMIVRFTQIDYDCEMAFVAVSQEQDLPHELGVGRYMMNPDGRSVEFALVVADDCQRLGIGSRLLKTLMQTAKDKGIATFEAEVLTANISMLALVKKLGFSIETLADNTDIVRVVKDLRQ
jgi:acetyltransferase